MIETHQSNLHFFAFELISINRTKCSFKHQLEPKAWSPFFYQMESGNTLIPHSYCILYSFTLSCENCILASKTIHIFVNTTLWRRRKRAVISHQCMEGTKDNKGDEQVRNNNTNPFSKVLRLPIAVSTRLLWQFLRLQDWEEAPWDFSMGKKANSKDRISTR